MEKPYNKYYNPSVQTKATEKYNSKNYDRASIRFYKGELDILKNHAESKGMSLNSYIRSLLVADGVLPPTKDSE